MRSLICKRPTKDPAAFLRITAAVGLLIPSLVFAEGAARLIDCQITQLCDAEGVCTAVADNVSFRLEPVSVDSEGAGEFQVTVDGTQSSMQGLSSTGPFVWDSDNAKNVLLISSERSFLWHRLELAPEPHSTIRYMICTFTQ